jgi:hypothetical protein
MRCLDHLSRDTAGGAYACGWATDCIGHYLCPDPLPQNAVWLRKLWKGWELSAAVVWRYCWCVGGRSRYSPTAFRSAPGEWPGGRSGVAPPRPSKRCVLWRNWQKVAQASGKPGSSTSTRIGACPARRWSVTFTDPAVRSRTDRMLLLKLMSPPTQLTMPRCLSVMTCLDRLYDLRSCW